ncbi:hypothetical protein [Nocardia abscessus]|uniref:hypothetical protein n=1 Tax=Nocardia abscessus TaxID=120957 RepID=UPI0024575B33|nr:hypothetical protein [Nocardia abscessus]
MVRAALHRKTRRTTGHFTTLTFIEYARRAGASLTPAGHCRFALGLRGPTTLMIPVRVPFFVELAKVTAQEIAARFAATG